MRPRPGPYPRRGGMCGTSVGRRSATRHLCDPVSGPGTAARAAIAFFRERAVWPRAACTLALCSQHLHDVGCSSTAWAASSAARVRFPASILAFARSPCRIPRISLDAGGLGRASPGSSNGFPRTVRNVAVNTSSRTAACTDVAVSTSSCTAARMLPLGAPHRRMLRQLQDTSTSTDLEMLGQLQDRRHLDLDPPCPVTCPHASGSTTRNSE